MNVSTSMTQASTHSNSARRPDWSPATGWQLAGAGLVVLLCLLSGAQILADPDTQWHIATGQWMIENRAWPRVDIFSYTFAGHPWIAKEWLSQLLLALAHLAGSWPAVVGLVAAAMAAATFMIARHVATRAGIVGGLGMGLLCFILVAPTLVARPHVLVFPVIVAWTLALVRSAEATRRPPWLALPLLTLWANMHAGFTMGCVVAAAFGLEALLAAKPAERIGVAVRWFAFGAACLVAVAITPYGLEPLLLNKAMASGNEGLQFITEWQSATLTPRWAAVVLVVAACLYALGREPRRNAARILLVAFLAYAMLRHQRFAMFFALVAPIVAGPALSDLCAVLCRRFNLFQTGALLPQTTAGYSVSTVSLAVAAVLCLAMPPAPSATVAPVAALASVPADLRREPVFNSYNLGGFLALNRLETFIDGRTDQLFLGGFMTRMMNAADAPGPGALAALLDRHAVRWALVNADAPEAAQLARLPRWRVLYEDAAARVYVRTP